MEDALCATCKQPTQPVNAITCSSCRKIYHKVAHCVTASATESTCSVCRQEKARILERSCPRCQKHLWSFHIECGKVF